MLLRELMDANRVKFIDGAPSWQEAVRLSCQPLMETGAADARYAEEIIACVEKYGPYIVLQPGFALPHAQEGGTGALTTAVSFMKSAAPISFEPGNPEKDAHIFFTLTSTDADAHLENIRKLFAVLQDEEFCAALTTAENRDDLLALDAAFAHLEV